MIMVTTTVASFLWRRDSAESGPGLAEKQAQCGTSDVRMALDAITLRT
jgi:hypothetical protein